MSLQARDISVPEELVALQGCPAVFGGSLDPFHRGHGDLLNLTAQGMAFSPYVVVPAHQPPHKTLSPVSAAERMRLVEAALSEDERFSIDPFEIETPGPHYAIDTLRHLQRQYGWNSPAVYVQGADSIETLWAWKDPERILDEFIILAIGRVGIEPEVIFQLMQDYPDRVYYWPLQLPDLSSTYLRAELAKPAWMRPEIEACFPPLVWQALRERNPYQP